MGTPRLKTRYITEIRPALQQELGLTNIMQVPVLEKIVVNMGIGDGATDAKVVETTVQNLTVITGQKPVVCRARKSISNFKLRAGQPIGVKVTLRGEHMWEFLDRLIGVAIPRVRDFRGVNPQGFDSRGNFTIGILEQLVFPEVAFDDIDKVRGLNITFVFKNATRDGTHALLTALGMPFRKSEQPAAPAAA